jgi:hypothetical protein
VVWRRLRLLLTMQSIMSSFGTHLSDTEESGLSALSRISDVNLFYDGNDVSLSGDGDKKPVQDSNPILCPRRR